MRQYEIPVLLLLFLIQKINFREFISTKDELELLDDLYLNKYSLLYSENTLEIPVVLRCSNTFTNKCSHPVNITATVVSNKLDVSLLNFSRSIHHHKQSSWLDCLFPFCIRVIRFNRMIISIILSHDLINTLLNLPRFPFSSIKIFLFLMNCFCSLSDQNI